MLGIYAFCAIVGIPLLLMMAFLGGDADVDFDGDLDLDLDFDADLDVDLDLDVDGIDGDIDLDTDMDLDDVDLTAEAVGSVAGDAFSGMLSVRSIIAGMAGFGSVGLIGIWTDVVFPVHVFAAAIAGVLLAYAASFGMAWLRANQSSSARGREAFEGNMAKVTVPVVPGGRGKITVAVEGRPTAMTASLFNEKAGQISVGDEVVVVEVTDAGTALVARLDELANE